jgi:hypothetical protein
MTDATRDEIRERLDRVQSSLADLQEELLLASVKNDIEEITTVLALLPDEIKKLRERGYVFRNFIERKAAVLAKKWEEVRDEVARESRTRVRELEREAGDVATIVRQATAMRAATVDRAEGAVDGLERRIEGSQSAIVAMYSTLKGNVWQAREEVKDILWMIDQVDAACFKLYPAEDLVVACKAQWLETKKDGPEGVLYLTDERLIFERKEKVATKKVLFIATEKELVQELSLELPVGQIEESKATDKGLFGGQELLALVFAPEADLSGVTLRLRGAKNEDWVAFIGRVQSGEIARERTTPKDEAVVEAAQSAPTKCTYCGATLDVTVVRGMREITCEYCGSVIRL